MSTSRGVQQALLWQVQINFSPFGKLCVEINIQKEAKKFFLSRRAGEVDWCCCIDTSIGLMILCEASQERRRRRRRRRRKRRTGVMNRCCIVRIILDIAELMNYSDWNSERMAECRWILRESNAVNFDGREARLLLFKGGELFYLYGQITSKKEI